MDEIPAFSKVFLSWAPLVVTLALSRRFGWNGLGIAMIASFALFLTVAKLQGEAWSFGRSIETSTNALVRTTYAGTFWSWIAGFLCAVALFIGWCRDRTKDQNK